MSSRKLFLLGASATITVSLAIQACKKSNTETSVASYPAVQAAFGDNINLNNLENYAGQSVPAYITKDNSGSNRITNAGATLGRVLFYDKALSANNNIACGSCHKQSMAFGDDAIQSIGVNGPTTRHSMRLVNARFAQEIAFFWDKRATTLESQTPQPIQNHNEMGFSGTNGDKDINFLITKLQGIGYYKELFKFVYGDSVVTQTRIQNAIAQFIRSIQSFDSKFDAGMAGTGNIGAEFPNLTAQENLGKQLFLTAPAPPNAPAGTVSGFGCQGCHRAPEFDIDPNSRNNGIITVAGSTTAIDITNTNPPSLRNLLNASGQVNGLYMHDGSINNLGAVIDHYAHIVIDPANTNLDLKLMPGGRAQVLNVTQQQKDAIIAFLATLSGKDVYTNKKWASPFK